MVLAWPGSTGFLFPRTATGTSSLLHDEGLICSVNGRGTFVAEEQARP